jgi:hypothetical protein
MRGQMPRVHKHHQTELEAEAFQVEGGPDEEMERLIHWLEQQTWSEFALSLADQYRTKGSLSPKQEASARSMRQKIIARATTLDISRIPAGTFALGSGEIIEVSKPSKRSSWHGWIFVKSGTGEKLGNQKPGATYRGKVTEGLQEILEDPMAAAVRYGKLTGTCSICGRQLTDEDSVDRGIGPVCLKKVEGRA